MNKTIKANQEQAIAAWVNYLNQLRIDGLLQSLSLQDERLQTALMSVDEAMQQISEEVVARNLGGYKGMHGFIAEVAEVGVGRARKQILGEHIEYQWVNDNGPIDLIRDGVALQQKFVQSGNRFSLGAVSQHLRKYPDFISNGGKYQIPNDYFEIVQELYFMSAEEAANTLTRSGEGPSLKDWQKVHDFFETGGVPFESIGPSNMKYAEVQKGAYASTLESEKKSLKATDNTLRNEAQKKSKPSLGEGAKATAVSVAVEGGMTFFLAVAAKRKEGKLLKSFEYQDWQEVLTQTGIGMTKGGIRGVSLYSLTNFTPTSAATASSIVTASLSIAELAHMLRNGKLSEQEFIENVELLSLEASISAVASLLGQAIIPIPVLGAVVGNTLGMLLYTSVMDALASRETLLIQNYIQEQRKLDELLSAEYQELVQNFEKSMSQYTSVLERAFAFDAETALIGSVEMAQLLGVPTEEILDSTERIHTYFLQ